MTRRYVTLAATLAGLTLLAAGCGGGGGSSEAATTTPTDAAALIAAEVAATPSGLTALGVTAPDPADARFHAYGVFGTPVNVFKPLVADSAAATTTVPSLVPSTVVPATIVPTTVTTPTTGTPTTTTGAPLVP
jgi:hypothetical protein